MTSDEAAALKIGDPVLALGPDGWDRARVWYKRHRKDSTLSTLDLRFPHGFITEVPLSHLMLAPAVDRLGELA